MTIRVVMVVPPETTLSPAETLDLSPTLTRMLEELHADGRVQVSACCGSTRTATTLGRDGINYEFAPSSELASTVSRNDPHVVHVHGTGFVRTLGRLKRTLDRSVALIVQHHGEQPGSGRHVLAHRLVRSRVDGYLFTGADHGQAEPFLAAGVIARPGRLFDVAEAGSLLATATATPVTMVGDPVILWVGRLVESKDPVAAIEAFAQACVRLPRAHLHLLATDRTLEPAVRNRIAERGLEHRIDLHPGVPHAEMSAWYAAAQIYLSTSHREGSNYSLIEALAQGCIPVVTSIPSHRALIGGHGATFERGDRSAAADALVAAHGMNPGDVQAWSAEHLSWPALVDRLVEVYQTVLGTRQQILE